MAVSKVPIPNVIVPVSWEDKKIIVIDQRRLPAEYAEVKLTTLEEVAEAIETMVVRGAPLIGITAAYGIALAAYQDRSPVKIEKAIQRMLSTRPTAYDLESAMNKQRAIVAKQPWDIAGTLLTEACNIHQLDLLSSRIMADHVSDVLDNSGWVMTICNTGALATGGGGTALAVIKRGHEMGYIGGVYVLETRPLLQGARLTCWELDQMGIPFKLIPDSAAASVLGSGSVDAIFTGADCIARNGDTANKIGTRMLARLAHMENVPFYIVAPQSTFNPKVMTGSEIVIEERDGNEVRTIDGRQIVPERYNVYNPSFDVTESGLITGYITNTGVYTPKTLEDAKIWT